MAGRPLKARVVTVWEDHDDAVVALRIPVAANKDAAIRKALRQCHLPRTYKLVSARMLRVGDTTL